jgi:RND family efflux transporter MFP subunit
MSPSCQHARPAARHAVPVSRFTRGLVLLLAVLLLSSGCTMLPREEETLAPPLQIPEKVSYETLEVKKGTIERKLRATGRFMSVSQANVQLTEQGGRLETIHIRIGDTVKKGDLLVTLDVAALADDIRLQEIAVERSRLSLERLKKEIEAEAATADPALAPAAVEAKRVKNAYDVQMAQLDIETNRLRLEGLRRAYEESRLESPIDGKVTYVADFITGDYIDTYQTVVTVADPTQLQLRYAEERVGEFMTGMPVVVTYDRQEYEGTVVMTPVDQPLDAKESMKQTVLIDLPALPEDARIGADAQIIATLERSEDTIVLPRYAINKNFGRTYVNVLVDNIREERDVEVGIQSETEVEILKGLELGELVIIR